MKLRHLLIITAAGVGCILLSRVFWNMEMEGAKSATPDSTSVTGSVGIVPSKAKFVQIQPVVLAGPLSHEIFIDALGYKEIRVFTHLAPADTTAPPIPMEAVMKVSFYHELEGMGSRYSTSTFRQEIPSYLQGLVTEKVYGKKIRLVIDADDLPGGTYKLYLSYYLLP